MVRSTWVLFSVMQWIFSKLNRIALSIFLATSTLHGQTQIMSDSEAYPNVLGVGYGSSLVLTSSGDWINDYGDEAIIDFNPYIIGAGYAGFIQLNNAQVYLNEGDTLLTMLGLLIGVAGGPISTALWRTMAHTTSG